MSHCRACRAPIQWALTPARARIPLDPEPSERGNVRLRWRATAGTPVADATVLSRAELVLARLDDEPLYLAHFASCPARAPRSKRANTRVRS